MGAIKTTTSLKPNRKLLQTFSSDLVLKMMFPMLLLFCLSAPSICYQTKDYSDGNWTFVPNQVVTIPGQCINQDGKGAKDVEVPKHIMETISIEKPETPLQCLKKCYKLLYVLDNLKFGGCSWNIDAKKCSLHSQADVFGDGSSGNICFSLLWF